METGFMLLLLISLVASFVDLTDPAPIYSFFVFYILVLLFICNLGLYVVSKLMTIIKLLTARKEGRTAGLGLQFSLFAVHLGIALVFLGNMLDLSLGYNAHVELIPGQTFTLPNAETKLKLLDFRIDYYPDGSPSQYTSKVLVAGQDSEMPYTITVNHPLEISGTKLYQESYGWLLNIELSEDGKSERFLVKPGEEAGQGENTIKIIDYIPNFVPREMYGHGGLGSSAIIYYIPQKNLTGAAKIGEKVKVSDDEYLTFMDTQAFTVLKVKTSPGLSFVEAGGALLSIGVVLVFLLRNKKSRRFGEDVENQ
jgi:cytochrome c biogenesis protein